MQALKNNNPTIRNFLDELSGLIKGKANEEMDFLRMLKVAKLHELTGKLNRGTDFHGWDKSYYMTQAATRTSWNLKEVCVTHMKGKTVFLNIYSYSIQYFSLGHCMAGLNLIANCLFGITLEVVPTKKGESWDRYVKKLRLSHETEGLIGYVYMDLFPRTGKFNSAANFAIEFAYATPKKEALEEGRREEDFLPRTSHEEDIEEGFLVPKVALVCNFDEPISVLGRPSLLSYDEVETLFHEFGHTLSNLLSRTRFQHTAGTRCGTQRVESC